MKFPIKIKIPPFFVYHFDVFEFCIFSQPDPQGIFGHESAVGGVEEACLAWPGLTQVGHALNFKPGRCGALVETTFG